MSDDMKEIREQLRKLTIMVTAMMSGDAIATPAELDDKYGDLTVRFDPKQWRGPSKKDRKASECPPEFLDLLAGALQGMGEKAQREGAEYKGKPEAPMKFRDARLARGWALRHRLSGKTFDAPKPPSAATTSFGSAVSFGAPGAFGGGGEMADELASDTFETSLESGALDGDIPFAVDMTGRRADRP